MKAIIVKLEAMTRELSDDVLRRRMFAELYLHIRKKEEEKEVDGANLKKKLDVEANDIQSNNFSLINNNYCFNIILHSTKKK